MSVFSVQSKVQVTKETTETIMKDHGKKWSQHISHLINAGFSPVCTTENKCLRKFVMEDCNWAILTERSLQSQRSSPQMGVCHQSCKILSGN